MNLVKLERISDMLRFSGRKRWKLAVGCSAYVMKNGRPIYRMNAGMADRSPRNKVDGRHHRAAVLHDKAGHCGGGNMIPIDRGQLDIYDKVSWFIPGVPGTRPCSPKTGPEPLSQRGLRKRPAGCDPPVSPILTVTTPQAAVPGSLRQDLRGSRSPESPLIRLNTQTA